MVEIELIYIDEQQQCFRELLTLKVNTTVKQALQQSSLLQQKPELERLKIGLYSKPINLEYILQPNDRLEFYRPLVCDPKERRRQQALKRKMT